MGIELKIYLISLHWSLKFCILLYNWGYKIKDMYYFDVTRNSTNYNIQPR